MRETIIIHGCIAFLEVLLLVLLWGWVYRGWFDLTLATKFWVPPARTALVSILSVMIIVGHAWVARRQSQG